jgi:hypothetical protein
MSEYVAGVLFGATLGLCVGALGVAIVAHWAQREVGKVLKDLRETKEAHLNDLKKYFR